MTYYILSFVGGLFVGWLLSHNFNKRRFEMCRAVLRGHPKFKGDGYDKYRLAREFVYGPDCPYCGAKCQGLFSGYTHKKWCIYSHITTDSVHSNLVMVTIPEDI